MYTIKLVSSFCTQCQRGNELRYRQEFDIADKLVIGSLSIEDLHGKLARECKAALLSAVVELIRDPKKHRALMPPQITYENMLSQMTDLIEALGEYSETTIEVITHSEPPF